MRTFGMSAAVLLAFAAPVWGQYAPLPAIPDGPPAPVGYSTAPPPAPGYQPGYPPGYPPNYVTLGIDGKPDYLPQIPPVPGSPPAPPVTANPDGFAFDPCYPCQRSPRSIVHQEAWIRGDWLYWSLRSAPIPPLIVTGNPNLPGAGIAGSGNVVPVVGPTQGLGTFSGARATVGQWFDPDGELGGELSAFVLQRKGSNQFFPGNANQSVSVPVIGTNGMVGVYDFSFPGRFAGALSMQTSTFLWGGEANLLHRFYGNGCVSVDGLFGYRYLQLDESLGLVGRTQSAGAVSTLQGVPLPGGTPVITSDLFRARTDFQGAQIGARIEVRRSLFTVTAFGKGGVGANIQTLRAEGVTIGGTTLIPGGIRVLPSNFGRDTNTDFSMLGETGIEVGLQVTKNVAFRVGYNALWWSDVLRPGTMVTPVATLASVPIDPTFNPNVVATRPVNTFRSSDFLAHGLVVGMLVEW